jgi:hypothetical protein
LFTVSVLEERWMIKGLREQAIDIEYAHLCRLREDIENQLMDLSISEDKNKEIQSQKISIQKKVSLINFLPLAKLFDVPTSKFDWDKISILNVWFEN